MWHEQDIADELTEYREARGSIYRWSELSDIVYTYTRAKWSGHRDIVFPFSSSLFVWGALYMFPKYTLRWVFFRIAGARVGTRKPIREVRNPKKDHKLDEIAAHNGCEPDRFRLICKKQLAYWPLLK